MLFLYPDQAHQWRHGPQGYEDYESYKPWLRDEFSFQCVYCRCREVWYPDGQAAFSVDHVRPVSIAPAEAGLYRNLVYACSQCNSSKRDQLLPFHPAEQSLAEHLEVGENGLVLSRTAEGTEFIRVCRLNRRTLVEVRQRYMTLTKILQAQASDTAASLLKDYVRFPKDLPNLRNLKPPDGNARPAGIADSCYERRQRGELPDMY